MDETTIYKEGYLLKRGKIIKNWKKRYFVYQDHYLFYYNNQSKKIKKGVINLFEAKIKECPNEFKNEINIFKIITKNRILYLKCDDSNMMYDWIDCLTKYGKDNKIILLDFNEDYNEEEIYKNKNSKNGNLENDLNLENEEANDENLSLTLTDENLDVETSHSSSAILGNLQNNLQNSNFLENTYLDIVDSNILKDKNLTKEEQEYLLQREIDLQNTLQNNLQNNGLQQQQPVTVRVKSEKKINNMLSSGKVIDNNNNKNNKKNSETLQQKKNQIPNDITSFFIQQSEKSQLNLEEEEEEENNVDRKSQQYLQKKIVTLVTPIEKDNPLERAFKDITLFSKYGNENENKKDNLILIKENVIQNRKEEELYNFYTRHVDTTLQNTDNIVYNEKNTNFGNENFMEYLYSNITIFILLSLFFIKFIYTSYILNNYIYFTIFNLNILFEFIFIFPIFLFLIIEFNYFKNDIFRLYKYVYEFKYFKNINLKKNYLNQIYLFLFLFLIIISILEYFINIGFLNIFINNNNGFLFITQIGNLFLNNLNSLFILIFILNNFYFYFIFILLILNILYLFLLPYLSLYSLLITNLFITLLFLVYFIYHFKLINFLNLEILQRIFYKYLKIFLYNYQPFLLLLINNIIIYKNNLNNYIPYLVILTYQLIFFKIGILLNYLNTKYNINYLNKLNIKYIILLNIKSIFNLFLYFIIFITLFIVLDIPNIVETDLWKISLITNILFILQHLYQSYLCTFPNLVIIYNHFIYFIVLLPLNLLFLLKFNNIRMLFILQCAIYSLNLIFYCFYFYYHVFYTIRRNYLKMVAHAETKMENDENSLFDSDNQDYNGINKQQQIEEEE
ncbi:hypothetical protein ABK040_001031 [Willaertia magna]